jgi:V/A-type H+-transporting ATPase subunit E
MASLEDLLNNVIQKVLEEIKTNVDQSFEESKKIVERAYTDTLNLYSAKVNELISKSYEEIEGEKAKLDVENKRLISSEKNFWIQKVFDEVKNKVGLFTDSESYQKGLEGIISREAKNGCIIYCNSEDINKVKTILSKLKIKAEVKEQNLLGGVKVEYPDQGLIRDYSLDLILNQVFESEKPRIAQILFGEE